MRHKRKCVLGIVSLLALAAIIQLAAGDDGNRKIKGPGNLSDPGPRTGPTDAGGPIAGLSSHENEYFLAGQEGFAEIGDVQGTITGHKGLGPTFNLDGCATCHAHPAKTIQSAKCDSSKVILHHLTLNSNPPPVDRSAG